MTEPLYRQYRCGVGSPLSCEHPRKAVEQDPAAERCLECGFPAILSKEMQIRGNAGIYQVDRFLTSRGVGRLYAGIRLSDNQPVTLKEYLLPEHSFNVEEARQRKRAFLRLAGFSLADGRVQDMRLVMPWDAIASFSAEEKPNDQRCYLVTQGKVDTHPTLRHHLKLHGALSPGEVRQALNQILQSLEFIHSQKFRLRSGQIQQGIVHGNLSLDSLLIARSRKSLADTQAPPALSIPVGTLDTEFFLYLTDLTLWEQLFIPPPFPSDFPTVEKDLRASGYIGFYLLAGGSVNSTSGRPLNPEKKEQWPAVDPPLRDFILRLIGVRETFESAEVARRTLLQLPLESAIAPLIKTELPEGDEGQPTRFRWWLLFLLLAMVLGALTWFLLQRFWPKPSVQQLGLACCIADLPGIPAGDFIYVAEEKGTWSYVLQQENLIEKGKTLETILAALQPKLQTTYVPEPSTLVALRRIQSKQAAFAITSLVDDLSLDLPANDLTYMGLGHKTFAYDGLVVFVSFSYAKRQNSLPRHLNGQIRFQQLRDIYTGRIRNWRQLGGPNMPVKLYIPEETEAIHIFEQRVLKSDEDIALFRQLRQTRIVQLRTFDTLRAVIRDFEDRNVGAIAFGTLSKVFGQCSVYPLALIESGRNVVQPLIQANGKPIDPATDLCKDKGSYVPDVQVFQTGRYPLGYPLAVIYPRDNSLPPAGQKFAEILRTLQAQRLLNETGLVPLEPLPED